MAEPIRTGGGNVELEQELHDLAALAPRRAGSEAERRAARHLEKRLGELGREAWTEPTRIRPATALTHLVHALAGILGSVLSVYQPLIGLLLAAAATVSALGDFTGAYHLVRSLMPARASQNVVSDSDTGKPGLLVLVAHYDAARAGLLADRRIVRIWPRALFWSLAVITICTVGRLLGVDATWFTLVQFIPTVVLILLVPALIDSAIADTGDGVADNAAGAALALSLANKQLEHFDLMLVFTGGSADFGLGMRPWLRGHRGDLDAELTAIVCLDDFAGGELAYAEKEGPVIAGRLHPTLDDLASEHAERYVSRELSDAAMARAAGLPTLRLSAKGADPGRAADADALEHVRERVSDFLDRIDEEIGPRLS